jgi:K+-sensing histidine kinase KdpD
VSAERYLRDLDFLCEATKETLSSLQLGPLLMRIAHLLHSRLGYDFAAVAVVEDDHVVFRAALGEDLEFVKVEEEGTPEWRIHLGQGLVGKAVTSKMPQLADEPHRPPVHFPSGYWPQAPSELVVPLLCRDEVVGVLDVQSNRPQAFGQIDVRQLEMIGALVAPTVHVASLHQRWRRRLRYLHIIGEMGRTLMTSMVQENVINAACAIILETLDISFCRVSLVENNCRQVLHVGCATRLPLLNQDAERRPLGEGLVGQVIQRREAIRLEDVSAFPGYLPPVAGMGSALGVPLKLREEVIGALEVEHSSKGHFTEEDQLQLEYLAVYLSQAIENARLFDSQRRRSQQLLVINEAVRLATKSIDLDQILSQVAAEVHQRFNYFAVAVMIVDEQEIVLRALRCDEELDLKINYRTALDQTTIAGKSILTGEVFRLCEGEHLEDRFKLRQDIQSLLCVPLRSQRGIIGAIQIQSLKCNDFGDDDRLVMETLAESVAGAIANARAVQRTEQIREDLIRMVVHDLRNPLQAVLLTLQEIERAAAGVLSQKVTDAVSDGITCTEDILGMVNSLLDVARFEAGKAKLRRAPAVLHDHLRAVVRRFAPIARSKHIQVTTVLAPDMPILYLEQELIERTLANLVSNALKFTPEGARVGLQTKVVREEVSGCSLKPPFAMIMVQDTGEGIPPEYRHKIFEKFGQVESRKAGLKMSTGLGLTLCRYVVRAHGGEIWVESKPGNGSCFLVALPLDCPET